MCQLNLFTPRKSNFFLSFFSPLFPVSLSPWFMNYLCFGLLVTPYNILQQWRRWLQILALVGLCCDGFPVSSSCIRNWVFYKIIVLSCKDYFLLISDILWVFYDIFFKICRQSLLVSSGENLKSTIAKIPSCLMISGETFWWILRMDLR